MDTDNDNTPHRPWLAANVTARGITATVKVRQDLDSPWLYYSKPPVADIYYHDKSKVVFL